MFLKYRWILTVVLVAASTGWAQDRFRTMFDPKLGQTPITVGGGYSFAPSQEVAGQDSALSISHYEASVVLPLSLCERDEWYFMADHATTRFNTNAVLPDSGRALPDAFYDPSLGFGYRHKLDNNWIWGGFFNFGSASDKPFDTWNEYEMDLTATLQTPIEKGRGWMFFLNYASNREFASGIPLPGLAYYQQHNEQFVSVLGIPFMMIFWHPVQPVTVEASWFPVRNVDTTVSLYFSKETALYTGFYWKNDRYLYSDRQDNNDRLVFNRKEVRLGLRHEFSESISINSYAGYQFDRFLFEGEDWSERNYNRIDIADGPIFAVNASWKF